MKRVIIKFKDGSHCNLDADFINDTRDGLIWVWRGADIIVGVFSTTDIVCAYITEKKGGD